ncbi:C-type lectin lectoxin-Phi1-like [Scylla paramamosain]|uniref:C-type lectin lectoxin-Phi1-like n=1 Tax=Scylla paramamosain TaxID=85552 RepID=UPI003082CC86
MPWPCVKYKPLVLRVDDGVSFDAARERCQQSSPANSSDLAHGMGEVTHSYLTSELATRAADLKADLVWVGVRKDPEFVSRTWRWVDGTVVDTPRWGRAQPNNYNGKQNCVALDKGRKWLWNDVGCELDYLPYVCQYVPSHMSRLSLIFLSSSQPTERLSNKGRHNASPR